jgi:hypothetical protein
MIESAHRNFDVPSPFGRSCDMFWQTVSVSVPEKCMVDDQLECSALLGTLTPGEGQICKEVATAQLSKIKCTEAANR